MSFIRAVVMAWAAVAQVELSEEAREALVAQIDENLVRPWATKAQQAEADLTREGELTGELTQQNLRLQRERDAFYAAIERAEMAQKAWTEIGARAEAQAVALTQAATDLTNVLTTLRYPDESALWRFGGQPLEHAYQALKDALATTPADAPLLSAAQRIVKAWDKLADCEAEFEDYDPAETCAEWRDALDTAILALKELIEGRRAESVPEMSPPRLDSASGAGDDGGRT